MAEDRLPIQMHPAFEAGITGGPAAVPQEQDRRLRGGGDGTSVHHGSCVGVRDDVTAHLTLLLLRWLRKEISQSSRVVFLSTVTFACRSLTAKRAPEAAAAGGGACKSASE